MQVLNDHKLLEFGEFRLDVDKKVLRRGDEIVSLPLKATELLCVLVENHGDVVPKDVLMERVWAHAFVEDSVLTQNIYLLRKTLKSNGTANAIKNVPRRGYVFDAPVGIANETVVEHHLTERVEIEETEEIEHSTGQFSRKPWLLMAVLLSGATALLAVGIYLYSGNHSRDLASSTPPPVSLKPPAVSSRQKTLAVIPFKGSDENFSANFSNDVSLRIGSMNKFPVKPFALVNEYIKNGAVINADLVLKGEVTIGKNSYTANVVVVDTKSGNEIRLGRFEYDNPVQVEDAVANAAANYLLGGLSDAERQAYSNRLPSNLAAYQYFDAAYVLWRRREDGSEYAKKAIELDSSFEPAYSLLASIKATGGSRDSLPAQEAEQLLQKAFALDENSAEAYSVQGFIHMFLYHDWNGAESSLKNAIELDENNVDAHHWLGVLYSIHRRLNDAKSEMQKALDIDPTNPTLLADIGQVHYFAGENDVAREFINRSLTIDPNHLQARQYLSELNSAMHTGDHENEMKQLVEMDSKTPFVLPYINVDPRYEDLRNDERFQDLLRKMNLAN